MTIKEFTEKLTPVLQKKISGDEQIHILPVIKNNDILLQGLVIRKDSVNISPTIYLDYYFKDFESGRDLDSIASDIYRIYEQSKIDDSLDVSFFTDFERAKEHIVYHLINKKRNQSMLGDIPYASFKDLAIVFYYTLDSKDFKWPGEILIHNCHLEAWGIDEKELYDIAQANTQALLGLTFGPIAEEIGPMIPTDSQLTIDDFYDCPMYVLSNKSKHCGAAALLYDDMLEKISAKLHDDYIIIPSSIHELLIIPAKFNPDIDWLNFIVDQVNSSELEPDEFLSDHVYLYSSELKTLSYEK